MIAFLFRCMVTALVGVLLAKGLMAILPLPQEKRATRPPEAITRPPGLLV